MSEHRVLLNPRWPGEDLRILRAAAEEVLRDHAREPSYILTSSGTSAGAWRAVKLVLLSVRAAEASARAVNRRFSVGAADRLARILPSFHVGGLGVETRARLAGAECVSPLGDDGKWDAARFAAESLGLGVTVASLVPTQLHDLMTIGAKPWPGLRLIWLGGGALSPGLEAGARASGWPLALTYGMTETASMIAVREEPDSGAGFEILPHARVERMQDGLLRVRGESLATGFARRTDEGLLRWQAIPEEGYLTEDRGHIRDGRLFIEGRESDQLKVSGENVNLQVLRGILAEECARAGLNVADYHLIARPEARRGAELLLIVAGGSEAETIRKAYDRRVLPFERFGGVIRVDRIPRTELGKVREAELAALLRDPPGRGR